MRRWFNQVAEPEEGEGLILLIGGFESCRGRGALTVLASVRDDLFQRMGRGGVCGLLQGRGRGASSVATWHRLPGDCHRLP